jgi:predicted ATPase
LASHFIQTVEIKGFGCLKDVTLSLSPLHALIGPNDSGKSTVLRALRTVLHTAVGRGDPSFDLAYDQLWPHGSIALVYPDELGYEVTTDQHRNVLRRSVRWASDVSRSSGPISLAPPPLAPDEKGTELQRRLTPARMVRLDGTSLRGPGNLIPSDKPLGLGGPEGAGLASLYDAILSRNVDGFTALREQIRGLFPTIKQVGLRNTSAGQKLLEFELVDGSRVGAEFMSEGLLYFMALAALPHLEPTSLLLIEEPENGLHPARIQEVMRLLRELSKTTQVVVATHSPLVINELEPQEVTLLTRDTDRGTRATLLKDTTNFEERSKVYALGELWLSYANGSDERELVGGSS